MAKRLLDCYASELVGLRGRELVESIRLSEGRVVAAEVVAVATPLIDGISNAELASAMGADIILLNFYDVTNPHVLGLARDAFGAASGTSGAPTTLADVQRLTGRLVGLNLEPIENPQAITTQGRLATPANAKAAVEQGAAFVVVTGNPGTGVTMEGVARSVAAIRQELASVVIIAGKMHAAGAGGGISAQELDACAEAGANGVLLPAPATVPGMVVDDARELVQLAHGMGLLVMNSIGTSQEGSSVQVVEQLALWSKMTGADIHHIGDAGYHGLAVPENISAFSIALRGRRHTWKRAAASILR